MLYSLDYTAEIRDIVPELFNSVRLLIHFRLWENDALTRAEVFFRCGFLALISNFSLLLCPSSVESVS